MHDKKNIFELWRENDEKLPFKVIIDSWNPEKHYAVVENVKIKEFPYGTAYGQYFFNGVAGQRGVIKNAGTYRWQIKLN